MTPFGVVRVEVVYALAGHAIEVTLELPAAATVADALAAAARDPAFAGLELADVPVGIFGKPTVREDLLQDGDRVEIYRGPAADAKAARRARLKGARRRT